MLAAVPYRPRLDRYLIASWVVDQLVAACMQRLSGVHRVKDHFVSNDNLQERMKGCFRS